MPRRKHCPTELARQTVCRCFAPHTFNDQKIHNQFQQKSSSAAHGGSVLDFGRGGTLICRPNCSPGGFHTEDGDVQTRVCRLRGPECVPRHGAPLPSRPTGRGLGGALYLRHTLEPCITQEFGAPPRPHGLLFNVRLLGFVRTGLFSGNVGFWCAGCIGGAWMSH